MGIFGLTSEVLTEYRVDAGQHKAELRELKLLEEELGAEQGKAASERNVAIGEWLEKLGKVTLALTAVKEIGEIVWDGYKEGITEARLETAAMNVDIEKLGEAAGGLKTHLELLTFAAKASNSAFKNSQDDLEMAERAMRALEARGYSTAEAQDAITNALVSGKTKGLEPFGIVVDKHIDKLQLLGEENLTLAQRTEVHQHALESLKIVADQVVDGQDNIGDSMTRTQVKLSDAWAEMKIGLGQLVLEMQPLIEALAETVRLVTVISHFAGPGQSAMHLTKERVGEIYDAGAGLMPNMGPGFATGDLSRYHRNPEDIGPNGTPEWIAGYGPAGGPEFDHNSTGYGEFSDAYQQAKGALDNPWEKTSIGVTVEDWMKRTGEASAKAKEAAKRLAAELKTLDEQIFKDHVKEMEKAMSMSTSMPGKTLKEWAAIEKDKELKAWDEVQAIADAARKQMVVNRNKSTLTADERYANYEAGKQGENETMLEKLFGPTDQFEVYKTALKGLVDSAVAGLDAMILSGEGGAAAFRKSMGAMLHGLALKEMAIGFADEGEAVAELIMGNPVGAAAKAAAGAKYLAIGVGLDIAAKELGFSAASSSSGSGGGGGGAPQAPQTYVPAGGSGQRDRTVVYADSFADDSARMKQLKAEYLISRVLSDHGSEG